MESKGSAPPEQPDRILLQGPAVGPFRWFLLAILLAAVATLTISGLYLVVIRLIEQVQDQVYQTIFSLWVILVHVGVGLLFLLPLIAVTFGYLLSPRQRVKAGGVGLGLGLLLMTLTVGASGILLLRLNGLPRFQQGTPSYWVVYGLHVAAPLAAVVWFVRRWRVRPALKWKWSLSLGCLVTVGVAGLVACHDQKPYQWNVRGSVEGENLFEPSSSRTVDGKYIAAEALMTNEYCQKCHEDAYKTHHNSAHHFGSFNNPAYLFSVKKTRERSGIKAARWCAGCHDPVPFFSGQFDDPHYDFDNNPTAFAGITCVSCHSMTHVNSRSGNGDYTIEEPTQYPFATSYNPALQWLSNQLVKTKPELHKKTMLKPFHRSEEFCSTCHKVGLPQDVNHYKEFLRGQNHADSFLLSGASGHGARAFYYPPQGRACAECHMGLVPSNDVAARDRDGSGIPKVHSHLFPGANTGIHGLVQHPGAQQTTKELCDFLQGGLDGKSPPMRVDLFGVKLLSQDKGKPERGVEAPLLDNQPLRPHLPKLQPGGTYLVEVVVRTLHMGHHFTQGTIDFNEIWVDFSAKSGGRVIGRSGGMDQGDDQGRVDEWAHFINAIVLDRHGNRIDRHNPEDIFTPLYDHQVPPGAGQVVHYRLRIPPDVTGPVELSARVRYRKFDYPYMEFTYGKGKVPKLPIAELCADRVVLPVAGVAEKVPAQESPIKATWQRWNDYGIACFLEGGPDGKGGGELNQAEACFQRLLTDEFKPFPEATAHGHLNLARVHLAYGGADRLEMARQALEKARAAQPPAPWQTVAWFNGLVNVQNARFDEAIVHFEQIVDPKNRDRKRRFDFTKDFVVINELGKTLFWRSQQEDDAAKRDQFLLRAVAQFENTLQLDPENVTAHEFLHKCYTRLVGDSKYLADLPGEHQGEGAALLRVMGKWPEPNANRMARLEVLRETASILEQVEKGPPLPLAVLLQAHEQGNLVAQTTEDVWLKLGMGPPLVRLDALLLGRVQELAQRTMDAQALREQRLAAAWDLARVMYRLNERPPQAEVLPFLVSAAAWPQAGLASPMALAALANDGHLHGSLPPPRRLIFDKIRPQLRALFTQQGDKELQLASGRILARLHLVVHGICKPDENAQDSAVRRYRATHPAADRASHAVVIYTTDHSINNR